jgi:hypothetical protein
VNLLFGHFNKIYSLVTGFPRALFYALFRNEESHYVYDALEQGLFLPFESCAVLLYFCELGRCHRFHFTLRPTILNLKKQSLDAFVVNFFPVAVLAVFSRRSSESTFTFG